eukprot:7166871-Prymnesium_polylepis.1
MYSTAPTVAGVRAIEDTLNLLLKRSVDVAGSILDAADESPDLLAAVDTLFALWDEALRKHNSRPPLKQAATRIVPHNNSAHPYRQLLIPRHQYLHSYSYVILTAFRNRAQALRTLSEFPQLLSKLFLCVARAQPNSTSVWAHATALLDADTHEHERVMPAIEWLSGAIVLFDTELARAPVFVDLKSAPRKTVILTDGSEWMEMVKAARPLVPESWYADARPSKHQERGGLFGDELIYEKEKELARAELEAQEAAKAEEERARREEMERQEAVEQQGKAAE